ncbi:alanine racemase C-terminal domain-containing protein [Leifsonia sp. F6_8S_P_1B]|uniref:Alanine racemase C-terminal domain-containing protein n=1 Tax=Leifsonia williamsii TaxID=3035919 RepID=A0ABT8KDM0_9MICO|nr:alanine racemase C-terminal domain-containing protein [Leifsonia williamsii]MDN4615555.1 alanine racemase C-terminal domain-containing protein [Leifsonia williamsii]
MPPAPGVRRRAFVDLAAIRSTAKRLGAPLPDCTADLRADAYGHGLIPVARALTDAGAGGFLVSRVEDAAALADDGIPVPARVAAGGSLPAGRTVLGPELFGLDPARETPPVMRLEAEVVAVKRVPAHRGVSYGYTYRTSHPTTLVLVGLGYADGILRVASNKAPVQVGATRGRVTGRIAMDQFVIDIGDGEAAPGDPVVLFGDPARGEPTVLDWADALGVAAPVITSRLGRRIERVHTA